MGFLLTSSNIFFQMHFVSTRVGRWDVIDDDDDDVCDDIDVEDYDNDVDDHKDYDDDIGAQVSEYDDYEYELKKEGVSEERTDGAYISVKYIPHICHLYHLWDLWRQFWGDFPGADLWGESKSGFSLSQTWSLPPKVDHYLMLIIIEIFRLTIIIWWIFWS